MTVATLWKAPYFSILLCLTQVHFSFNAYKSSTYTSVAIQCNYFDLDLFSIKNKTRKTSPFKPE